MPKTSHAVRTTRAMSIVAGLQKRFHPSEPVRVDGKAHSRKAIVALFQAQIDAIEQVRVARAAFRAAVTREHAIARRTTALTLALRNTIVHQFGRTRTAFADFGWELPKKRGPKTLAGKVTGAEKARATRLARARRDG